MDRICQCTRKNHELDCTVGKNPARSAPRDGSLSEHGKSVQIGSFAIGRTERWAETLIVRARPPRAFPAPFDIDADYIRFLWIEQEGRCYWFGLPMVTEAVPKDLRRPVLNRLVAKRGYVKGNVVLCSQGAAVSRRDADPKDFDAFVALVKRSPACVRRSLGFDFEREWRKQEFTNVGTEGSGDPAGPHES